MSSRNFYPITGRKSTGAVFDRIPIAKLQAEYQYQWALFVLGYAWIKGTPIPFPGVVQPPLKSAISFMEIGAIHGKPYREWTGDLKPEVEAKADYDPEDKKDTYPIPSRFGGYCNHTSVSFPTWHRPYVMLIEQAIGEYADNIAQQIENSHPNEQGLWVRAARELRFPYWDWAHPDVETEGFPAVFYEAEATIMATGQQMVTVPNPLSFFTFPYIPDDFTETVRRGLTAYYNLWPQTFRRANQTEEGGSNIDTVISDIKRGAEDMRTKVGMLFTFPEDGNSSWIWDQFSNTLNESRQENDATAIGSLEAVHGSIHSFVGGNGHMGHPDYAGFDPFFYFHHSNVDRIIALWEWCYTDYWMNKGYIDGSVEQSWTQQAGTFSQVYNEKIEDDGEFGTLAPWRREDGEYWTNNDTRFLTPNVYPKYYSYDAFLDIKVDVPAADKAVQRAARARISRFYGIDPQASARARTHVEIPVPTAGEVSPPSNLTTINGFRLFVILARLPEHAFGRSYDLRIYYKNDILVGNISVFAREDNSPCKACAFRRESASLVRGTINIPPRIVSQIIVESGIDRASNTMEITTELLTKALTGKLLDTSGTVLASAIGGDSADPVPAEQAAATRVQPVEVALVSSAVAENTSDSKEPVFFFDWNSHKALFPSGWKAENGDAAQV